MRVERGYGRRGLGKHGNGYMSDGNDGNDGTGTGWEATAAPFHLSVSLSHM